MGMLLTKNGSVECGHKGKATISGSGKLTVNGAVVMREADVSAWTIAGCTQTKSDNGQVPCVSILSVQGGKSGKLTVQGSAVLLENMTALSKEGKPANDVAAKSAGQDKFKAS